MRSANCLDVLRLNRLDIFFDLGVDKWVDLWYNNSVKRECGRTDRPLDADSGLTA